MRGDEVVPPARLLIVDDHDLMRESTHVMLEGEPDLQHISQWLGSWAIASMLEIT